MVSRSETVPSSATSAMTRAAFRYGAREAASPLPPARPLHASVGEASAVRRERRAQLIDAVRVRADDAARLLVEGERTRCQVRDRRRQDPPAQRCTRSSRWRRRQLVRRSAQEGRCPAGADQRGNGQDAQRPSAAAGAPARPRAAPQATRPRSDRGPVRDRASVAGRPAAWRSRSSVCIVQPPVRGGGARSGSRAP